MGGHFSKKEVRDNAEGNVEQIGSLAILGYQNTLAIEVCTLVYEHSSILNYARYVSEISTGDVNQSTDPIIRIANTRRLLSRRLLLKSIQEGSVLTTTMTPLAQEFVLQYKEMLLEFQPAMVGGFRYVKLREFIYLILEDRFVVVGRLSFVIYYMTLVHLDFIELTGIGAEIASQIVEWKAAIRAKVDQLANQTRQNNEDGLFATATNIFNIFQAYVSSSRLVEMTLFVGSRINPRLFNERELAERARIVDSLKPSITDS